MMKRPLVYLLTVLLLCLLSSFGWQKVFAKTAGEYLEEGAKLEEAKDYAAALDLYMRGIKERPKNYKLYYRIANMYQMQGKHFKAVEYFLISALKGYEMGFEWYDLLSRSYYEIGKERFFTKELCKRLIYNTMVRMEFRRGQGEDEKWIKKLEEYLGYFDKAHKGGISYILPEDIFGEREKMFYVDRARKKLENYYKYLNK